VIIGQDPVSGEQLQAGQAVDVTVSAGKDKTTVPDLVGLTTLDDARAALTGARLVLGKVTLKDIDKPEGTVLEQDVAANTSVDVGTLISITVSSGKIAVPNVVGSSKVQANNDLIAAGFKVSIILAQNGAVADGTVLAQTPGGGSLFPKGSVVTITVSQLPIVTPSPTPTVP
jgi:serine/threonine-protein kinase